MINKIKMNAGSKSLPSTETKWFNLSTRHLCPAVRHISQNRNLIPTDKRKRKDLKRDIATRGAVLEPILCDSQYNIYSGQNRWAIVNELWDNGINVIVGFTVNPLLDKCETPTDRIGVLQSLNKGTVWSPTEKLEALSKDGNATAERILSLANEPSVYTQKGIYGIRNAFVAMGLNPDDFETLPRVLSQADYNLSNKIFTETNRLLSLGIKKSDKANNWTEAFIKAWRRIRTNDETLKSENEDGERTSISTQSLNSKIDELGIDRIAKEWRTYADKAFSSGKVGRWAKVLESTIEETWKYENGIK